MLWEQEVGSSNLSTPTEENTIFLWWKPSFYDEGFLFITHNDKWALVGQTYSTVGQTYPKSGHTFGGRTPPTQSLGGTPCVLDIPTSHIKQVEKVGDWINEKDRVNWSGIILI